MWTSLVPSVQTTSSTTVASGAHTPGCLNFDDLQGEQKYSGQRAYRR